MTIKEALKQLISTLLEANHLGLYEQAMLVCWTLRNNCDAEMINLLVDTGLEKGHTYSDPASWFAHTVQAARLGASKDRLEQLLGVNPGSKWLTGPVMSMADMLTIARMGVSADALKQAEDYILSRSGYDFGGFEARRAGALELRRLREIPE